MSTYRSPTKREHKSTGFRRFVPLGLDLQRHRLPRVPLSLHPGLPTLRPQSGLGSCMSSKAHVSSTARLPSTVLSVRPIPFRKAIGSPIPFRRTIGCPIPFRRTGWGTQRHPLHLRYSISPQTEWHCRGSWGLRRGSRVLSLHADGPSTRSPNTAKPGPWPKNDGSAIRPQTVNQPPRILVPRATQHGIRPPAGAPSRSRRTVGD